jgi:hypothetical protein
MSDIFLAFKLGRTKAAEDFYKTASAKDIAAILELVGAGAKSSTGALASAAASSGKNLATGTKNFSAMGLNIDPRMALLGGAGLVGAGALGGELLAKSLSEVSPKLVGALPTAAGAAGGLLAAAANPGLLGGSRATRITHELAQSASSPAGMVATMAGLVGLPAALIGYGKMKAREENRFF